MVDGFLGRKPTEIDWLWMAIEPVVRGVQDCVLTSELVQYRVGDRQHLVDGAGVKLGFLELRPTA